MLFKQDDKAFKLCYDQYIFLVSGFSSLEEYLRFITLTEDVHDNLYRK